MATKRLKELLEARKSSARDSSGMFCLSWWKIISLYGSPLFSTNVWLLYETLKTLPFIRLFAINRVLPWTEGSSIIEKCGAFTRSALPFILQFSNCVSSSRYCQWKWNKWTGNDVYFFFLGYAFDCILWFQIHPNISCIFRAMRKPCNVGSIMS